MQRKIGLAFLSIALCWLFTLYLYKESGLEYNPTQSKTYLKAYFLNFFIPSGRIALINKESDSMYPAVKNTDICIIVVNYPFDKLEAGDVVSIKYPDCKVLHRLIRKEKTGWITKGDNNDVEDDIILHRYNYLGKLFVDFKL
jgi:signal peptidase I